MKKPTILISITVLFIVIGPYVAAGWNELPVNENFRSQAPGHFVELTDGYIHYRWFGKPSAEIVVLVHGVSVPQYVFAQATEALVDAGFRVLLFDLFGHGFSDRPVAAYDADFFARQMIETFDALELNEPVHVGALSMGGVIVADFTARHPERVKSLMFFAPAGLRLVNDTDSTFVKLIKSPVVGHWLWRIIARDFYFPEDGDSSPDDEVDSGESLQGIPKEQADYAGYLMAMRQIFRNLRLDYRDDLLLEINRSPVPVLGIFGDADDTIHLESAALLADLVPRARVEILAGATHHLNIHRWRDVHEIMMSFLRNNGVDPATSVEGLP